MRNLFDQYSQPENRLSHALAVCLHEDRALLAEFLGWVGVKAPCRPASLWISEQNLPGDPPETEEEAERRGLPDIVIHDDSSWCVLIESKVQAAFIADQLDRHERTLRRRGFRNVTRVVLTKADVHPRRSIRCTWSEVYEWLGGSRIQSPWGDRLRSYLRIAEVRLAREEYLTEGTLTMFDGFRFSEDNPYTYGEGKRLLKLAMAELKKDRSLKRLGMDPFAQGRSAITGRGSRAVWDFLSLTDRPRSSSFTSYPHLTLAVHADHLEVATTIPNGVIGSVRSRLIDLGVDGLTRLNVKILKRARRLMSLGGDVCAYAMQRHYPSQRSPGIVDARMVFNLETCRQRHRSGVKLQREWVAAFAELLRGKRANLQFGYMVLLPWETKGLDRRDSLELIAESWLAMEPLLDAVRGKM